MRKSQMPSTLPTIPEIGETSQKYAIKPPSQLSTASKSVSRKPDETPIPNSNTSSPGSQTKSKPSAIATKAKVPVQSKNNTSPGEPKAITSSSPTPTPNSNTSSPGSQTKSRAVPAQSQSKNVKSTQPALTKKPDEDNIESNEVQIVKNPKLMARVSHLITPIIEPYGINKDMLLQYLQYKAKNDKSTFENGKTCIFGPEDFSPSASKTK